MSTKPPCELREEHDELREEHDMMLFILFRVPDALKAVEREDQLAEFLKRAEACFCCEEMVRLARERVELDD